MKFITLVLTVALTATITIIVTAAVGTPITNFFSRDRLEVAVSASPWHPYPTKRSGPLRLTFAVLSLENATKEKITNIKLRLDGDAKADIVSLDAAPSTLVTNVDEFDFPDMKPGDYKLYYMWFDKAVTGNKLEESMRLFSSQGTPRLLLIESQVFEGETFETLQGWARAWMPILAGFLSLICVFGIALVETRNGKALRRALQDEDYYLAECVRYEANPEGYVPSKPPPLPTKIEKA